MRFVCHENDNFLLAGLYSGSSRLNVLVMLYTLWIPASYKKRPLLDHILEHVGQLLIRNSPIQQLDIFASVCRRTRPRIWWIAAWVWHLWCNHVCPAKQKRNSDSSHSGVVSAGETLFLWLKNYFRTLDVLKISRFYLPHLGIRTEFFSSLASSTARHGLTGGVDGQPPRVFSLNNWFFTHSKRFYQAVRLFFCQAWYRNAHLNSMIFLGLRNIPSMWKQWVLCLLIFSWWNLEAFWRPSPILKEMMKHPSPDCWKLGRAKRLLLKLCEMKLCESVTEICVAFR